MGSGQTAVEYIHSSDPRVFDQLISELAPHSMVINATGIGEDVPGSPVTDAGTFPT